MHESSDNERLGAFEGIKDLSDLEFSDFESKLKHLIQSIEKKAKDGQRNTDSKSLIEGVFISSKSHSLKKKVPNQVS